MRLLLSLFALLRIASAQSPELPVHPKLIPTLWVQTSQEWRGLCLQTYRVATQQLNAALKDKSWTAAVEQSGKFRKRKPAVVLDIDETVLDNSAGQARQVLGNTGFVPADWNQWVTEQKAPAIPGALEFCRYADSRKVRVLYVTNRDAAQEEATIANLTRLGFPASKETVLCRGEKPEWASEKSPRRQEIAATHRILLLIGDDLGDFLPGVRTTIEKRAELAQPYESYWGKKWFLLPNPGYGSWEDALIAPDPPADPRQRLERKRTRLDPMQGR